MCGLAGRDGNSRQSGSVLPCGIRWALPGLTRPPSAPARHPGTSELGRLVTPRTITETTWTDNRRALTPYEVVRRRLLEVIERTTYLYTRPDVDYEANIPPASTAVPAHML